MSALETVRVNLGARSYDIIIGDGILAEAGKYCAPLIGAGKAAIITDANVGPIYGQALAQSLAQAGIECVTLTLPAGEATKNFAQLQDMLEKLLGAEFERSDTLIALGGGVIGDITGFAASVLKRGCKFIQIPTTLLAQVDSSVGGKTAINSPHGKNLIGAFYQPKLVLADMAVLSTLPKRQLKAGYAEVVKYGLLGSEDFFGWLEANGEKVLKQQPAALGRAIAISCRMKADIVATDEREHGQRALLNLGHSFGHAFEALAGYQADLLHGEAVAAGMSMAFDYSRALGLCSGQDAARVKAHFSSLGLMDWAALPARVREQRGAMLSAMMQDKKNEGGALTLILTRGIGRAFVSKGEDAKKLNDFLLAYAKDGV
ncbi:3-dehydroquinate synthase [Robiginitomaculum antarcticum]|uniref:3-dehydroquinate synthase n=1 Tax=Robiginitomaculum antarcticum TaxID=437507 RepID=UPI000369E726|nr:3-dehydroquinate synthase [Robiginitomaculum antarcticum]